MQNLKKPVHKYLTCGAPSFHSYYFQLNLKLENLAKIHFTFSDFPKISPTTT